MGFSYNFAPGTIEAHAHTHQAQVMSAVRGTMTVAAEQGRWVLPPGRALWVPPRIAHTVTNAKPIELRTLYVAPDAEGTPEWSSCVILAVTPLVQELILACVGLDWDYSRRGRAPAWPVFLDRLATLSQEPLHLPKPRDPRGRAAVEAVRHHPADRRTLLEIPREVGASGRTLVRLFLSETGLSFGVWRLRLLMPWSIWPRDRVSRQWPSPSATTT